MVQVYLSECQMKKTLGNFVPKQLSPSHRQLSSDLQATPTQAASSCMQLKQLEAKSCAERQPPVGSVSQGRAARKDHPRVGKDCSNENDFTGLRIQCAIINYLFSSVGSNSRMDAER